MGWPANAEDKEPLISDQNRKNFFGWMSNPFFKFTTFFFFFSFEFGDQKKRVGVRNWVHKNKSQ